MDSKLNSLISNTIVYAIGNLGSKVLTFALIPIYSFYLKKSDFGYFDLVITTITLLIPLLTFQISDGLFRWLIDKNSTDDLHKTEIISSGFIIIAFIITLLFVSFFVVKIIHPIPYQGIIFYFLFISSCYPIFQQTIRGLGLNKKYAASGIINSFVLLVSTVIFLIILDLKILSLFLSGSIAITATVLYLIISSNLLKFLNFKKINKKTLKEMALYSLPLVPNTISWWLVNSANKYLILFYLGTEFNGIFGLANRFPGLLVMVNSIFMMAWQESAITSYNDKERSNYYSKVFSALLWFQISLAAVFSISSEFIVSNFISPEYYEAWKFMPYLFFGVAFSTLSGFYGSFYLSAKKTKLAFYTSSLGAIINVIVCLFSIEHFGLFAAAISTSVGYLILFLVRLYNTRFIARLKYYKPDLLVLIVIIFSLWMSYQTNNIFKLISILIAIGLPIIIKSKDIFNLINSRKRNI